MGLVWDSFQNRYRWIQVSYFLSNLYLTVSKFAFPNFRIPFYNFNHLTNISYKLAPRVRIIPIVFVPFLTILKYDIDMEDKKCDLGFWPRLCSPRKWMFFFSPEIGQKIFFCKMMANERGLKQVRNKYRCNKPKIKQSKLGRIRLFSICFGPNQIFL